MARLGRSASGGPDSRSRTGPGGILAAVERLGDAPELYAVSSRGPEPIPIANRVQTWTVGARFALERRWDGRLTP